MQKNRIRVIERQKISELKHIQNVNRQPVRERSEEIRYNQSDLIRFNSKEKVKNFEKIE